MRITMHSCEDTSVVSGCFPCRIIVILHNTASCRQKQWTCGSGFRFSVSAVWRWDRTKSNPWSLLFVVLLKPHLHPKVFTTCRSPRLEAWVMWTCSPSADVTAWSIFLSTHTPHNTPPTAPLCTDRYVSCLLLPDQAGQKCFSNYCVLPNMHTHTHTHSS